MEKIDFEKPGGISGVFHKNTELTEAAGAMDQFKFGKPKRLAAGNGENLNVKPKELREIPVQNPIKNLEFNVMNYALKRGHTIPKKPTSLATGIAEHPTADKKPSLLEKLQKFL